MPVDLQTMLVATDFSEASAPATAYAFSLARSINASLYIMHVVPEDDVRIITAICGHLQSEVTPQPSSKPSTPRPTSAWPNLWRTRSPRIWYKNVSLSLANQRQL